MTNLVTFEQAKRLNELGYRVPSAHGYYTKGKGEYVTIQQYREDREYQLIPSWLYANTVSDAAQWIREDKNIPCAVMLEFEADLLQHFYYGEYCKKQTRTHSVVENIATFDTHPLAESALLDDLLTYLEENNHGNK